MTLQEYFQTDKVTMEMVEERSDESDYWGSAYSFVYNNRHRDVESLSPKQSKWMDDIFEDMVEWRIKNA